MEQILQGFTCYTLVDITRTGVIRNSGDDLARNQQRNWETLIQCIGLRTQPQHIAGPESFEVNMDEFEFGEMYTGRQRIWAMRWAVESTGIYELNNDPFGGLLADFDQVPIITGLDETARFLLPIFYPHGAIKNIYFEFTHL